MNFQYSNSLSNLVVEIDKWSNDCRSYLMQYLEKVSVYRNMSFQAVPRFINFTANYSSGITTPQRKCFLIMSHIRLYLIDLSSFREKNMIKNILPSSRLLNLRVQPYSLLWLLLQL